MDNDIGSIVDNLILRQGTKGRLLPIGQLYEYSDKDFYIRQLKQEGEVISTIIFYKTYQVYMEERDKLSNKEFEESKIKTGKEKWADWKSELLKF